MLDTRGQEAESEFCASQREANPRLTAVMQKISMLSHAAIANDAYQKRSRHLSWS